MRLLYESNQMRKKDTSPEVNRFWHPIAFTFFSSVHLRELAIWAFAPNPKSVLEIITTSRRLKRDGRASNRHPNDASLGDRLKLEPAEALSRKRNAFFVAL